MVNLRGQFSVGSVPAVNVVFFVPGSLQQPDFAEIRESTFSKKQKLLLIQVPLPVNAMSMEEVRAFVVTALHKANALAFHFYQDREMQFPLRQAEELVANLEAELQRGFSTD